MFLKNKTFLFDQNFLFKSKMQSVYIYLINTNFNFIFIHNNIDFLFIISYKYKIGLIIKYKTKKGYFLNVKNHFLIIKSFKKKKSILKKFINRLFSKSVINKISIKLFLKTQLLNEITIYGN